MGNENAMNNETKTDEVLIVKSETDNFIDFFENINKGSLIGRKYTLRKVGNGYLPYEIEETT